MNSERKEFEKRFYKADWIIWDEVLGKYISKDPLCQTTAAYNHMFFVWQASAQRQGYKLVPVEPTRNMEIAGMNEYHKLVGIGLDEISYIYKAMIGAVDE